LARGGRLGLLGRGFLGQFRETDLGLPNRGQVPSPFDDELGFAVLTANQEGTEVHLQQGPAPGLLRQDPLPPSLLTGGAQDGPPERLAVRIIPGEKEPHRLSVELFRRVAEKLGLGFVDVEDAAFRVGDGHTVVAMFHGGQQ